MPFFRKHRGLRKFQKTGNAEPLFFEHFIFKQPLRGDQFMTHYKFHELANIFPMLEGDELDALRTDMDANGQINKIILYQGKVLDGRNRYRVCEMLGIEPETIVYPGDDPIGLVLSQNIHRRHLTVSQRTSLAVECRQLSSTFGRGDIDSTQENTIQNEISGKTGNVTGHPTQATVAKVFGMSESNVRRAEKLQQHAPETFQRVRQGELELNTALKQEGIVPTPGEKGEPGKDGKIRPAKYKPRKKIVAKESAPEPEDKADEFAEMERELAEFYEACVGKKPEKFLKIPYPHCLATESKILCVCYGDTNNELQHRLAEETEKLGEALFDLTHPE